MLIVITDSSQEVILLFDLSSFNPSKVLKGKLYLGRDGALPRKLLVVFQFSFSIILIIGTVVIYQQWNMQETDSWGTTSKPDHNY